MEFIKAVNESKSREVVVTKNQLRAALGIVKTKSAAIQYEERIAELHAAGSDVGDFGHSRKLFPAMLSAHVLISTTKRRFFFQLLFRAQEFLHTSMLQQTSPRTIESLIK